MVRRDLPEGLVAGIHPGAIRVSVNGGELDCRPHPDAAIGDRVLVWPERLRVAEVLPRRTKLSRPDPHNPRAERILAANIDVVAHVVSVRVPPLRPGLIDRILLAAESGGAGLLLCVNKIDLLEDEEELRPLEVYEVPMVRCSAATGQGIDALRNALAGKLCVFTGHSGVGKSSLLNALAPELRLKTGEVSGKGRHTTSASRLYRLDNGAGVIDTPGIREFGLWKIDPGELRRRFFAGHALCCRFSDCSHAGEPGCAVSEAVEAGAIPAWRYAAYRRLASGL